MGGWVVAMDGWAWGGMKERCIMMMQEFFVVSLLLLPKPRRQKQGGSAAGLERPESLLLLLGVAGGVVDSGGGWRRVHWSPTERGQGAPSFLLFSPQWATRPLGARQTGSLAPPPSELDLSLCVQCLLLQAKGPVNAVPQVLGFTPPFDGPQVG